MKKTASLGTALALTALAVMLAGLWLQRAFLDYNSEGRHFDAAQGVVYSDGAIVVYGLLALLAAALAIVAVIWTLSTWRR